MRLRDEPTDGSHQTVDFCECHADMSKCNRTTVSASTVGLTGMARQTVAGRLERMSQLYERGADAIRIGQYVRRWLR
jgi:hypothetical protein